MEVTLQERIIAVQKQLRIAIQNHDVLIGKKHTLPNRDEIKGHIEVIQWLIISMGKKQALLLNELRHEIAAKHELKPNSTEVKDIIKKLLAFSGAPKHIPVYKPVSNTENESKKDAPSKPKLMKSVLKVNNKDACDSDKDNGFIGFTNSKLNTNKVAAGCPKIKVIYNKKKEGRSILIRTKNLKSVLKPKNLKVINQKAEEDRSSPESVSSSSSSDVKYISPHSTSPFEEADTSESPLPVNRVDTRFGKKYQAKPTVKHKTLYNQTMKIKQEPVDYDYKDSYSDWIPMSSAPINSSEIKQEPHLQHQTTIDDLDKESFLGLFRLGSKAKCEQLKRKRCERKRRSVAGQSSMYTDYFQPLPRRTYSCRKSVIPTPTPSTITSNTSSNNNSNTSTSTANNAVIVESPSLDDEDEEKPAKISLCFVCHEEDDDCVMESCIYCCEGYHFNCIPKPRRGFCPSCMAQTSTASALGCIIGALGVTEEKPLPVDVIKRYLNENVPEKDFIEKK